jgi:hypothetical protein
MGWGAEDKKGSERMAQIWTEAVDQRLKELRQVHSQEQTAFRLSEEFGYNFTRNAVKNREAKLNELDEDTEIEEPIPYKETVEILSDGSHKSDKLLKMSSEQAKDVEYLLDAHGFDKDAWELVSAKNNIWNSYSKQDGVMTLYSSKITVKPKVSGVNWDNIINKIENIKPKIINPEYIRDIDYLNIPLFDMHFGISDYEYYKHTQQRIAGLLERGYKGVLFIIGQDLLHNDNFKGTTANGTPIDKVDMEKAWDDAMLFYIPLIELAIEKCNHVKIMYSKGNHDESMSWAFVKALKARFPQADIDTRFRERKAHMLGLNFIGINHGDKKKEQNLTENFATEFLFEWSKSKTREIFTGHLHTERVIDKGGVVLRRMPTANKIDGYHDDHGFTTAHKRFEVLEYSEEAVKRIHYV